MRKLFTWVDPQYAKIALHAIVAALIAFAAGMILWYSTGMFVKLWELFCAVVEPLVYGSMISYLLQPLVRFVSQELQRFGRLAGNPKSCHLVAVAISVTLVTLAVLGVLGMMLVLISHSISSINFETLNELIGSAQVNLNKLLLDIQRWLSEFGLIDEESLSIMGAVGNVSSHASKVVFSIVFAIYLLIDGDRALAYAARLMRAIMGGPAMLDPGALLSDADRVFSGYFRGQALDACAVGLLASIALSLARVPFAPIIGVLAGIGNLIPYVGGPVGFASVAMVCLAEGEWGALVRGIIAMALVMAIDGNVVNPRLLSDNIEVHPLLVVAALIAGGAIGGIAGMLVSVPTAAFIKIQIDRWMERREAEAALAASAQEPTDSTDA